MRAAQGFWCFLQDMATKIDLLPGYVKWTKRFHYTIAGAVVGLGLWTGGLLLIYHSKQLELQTAQENEVASKVVADAAAAAATAKDTAVSNAGSYITANNFYLDACKTGSKRAAILNLIRNYLDQNSGIKAIDISDGSKVVISASVANPDQYAQFLLGIRNATGVVFSANPRYTQTSVNGFGNGTPLLVVPQPQPGDAPVIFNYPINLQVEGTLLYPLDVPPDPTAGAAAAGAAPGLGGAPAAGAP